MKIEDQVFGMSSAAREVLEKLFLFGPRLDGDVPSKAGRGELIQLDLCSRWNGWNWLNQNGIRFAVEVMLLEGKKERFLKERSDAIHHYRHCAALGSDLGEELTRAMLSTTDPVTRNHLRDIVNRLSQGST